MDLNKELSEIRQLLEETKTRGEIPGQAELAKHLEEMEQAVTQLSAKLGPLMARTAAAENKPGVTAPQTQAAAGPAGHPVKVGAEEKAGKAGKPVEKDDMKMLAQCALEHALPADQLGALVWSLLHDKKEAPPPRVTTSVNEGEAWEDWDDFKNL